MLVKNSKPPKKKLRKQSNYIIIRSGSDEAGLGLGLFRVYPTDKKPDDKFLLFEGNYIDVGGEFGFWLYKLAELPYNIPIELTGYEDLKRKRITN